MRNQKASAVCAHACMRHARTMRKIYRRGQAPVDQIARFISQGVGHRECNFLSSAFTGCALQDCSQSSHSHHFKSVSNSPSQHSAPSQWTYQPHPAPPHPGSVVLEVSSTYPPNAVYVVNAAISASCCLWRGGGGCYCCGSGIR